MAAGFPDLVMTRERVLFAELKSAKGVLSDEQSDWVGGLVGAKAEFHLWKPEDWQDGTIENVLRRRSPEHPLRDVTNSLTERKYTKGPPGHPRCQGRRDPRPARTDAHRTASTNRSGV
jgi:hypothetical protein